MSKIQGGIASLSLLFLACSPFQEAVMTVLHSVDFFPSGKTPVAIEPRLPQSAFPEHHHDFHEIVIVEHGTGIHVFNGQPYSISGGSVCFIRDHDRHLYEHTDNLCLTNVLYRSPEAFQFLTGLNQLLPQEQDGHYASHWRVNQGALQQVRQIVGQMEQSAEEESTAALASREILFMQLLVLLRKSSLEEGAVNNDARLNQMMAWLEDHFADEVCWASLADRFSLSLRTLHRQLKQHTGMTPQRYLNRLRLIKARHLLRHSDESVTDIAFRCGFGDSNHFSTLFRREFSWSPRDIRQGRDAPLQ
jgi:AraC family L-rhamnose operon regulatory protein RhaS